MNQKPIVPAQEHPYRAQPAKAFWKNVVQDIYPMDVESWYTKKFPIANERIATAGSCFAQHIGRELRNNGFNYVDAEPAPGFLHKEKWLDFGYGMYSARYGNVYTPRQLLQLIKRALGEYEPEEAPWLKDSGYVDPFRPTIEPEPFESIDEVIAQQKYHLKCVTELFENCDIFIFTLGLTEAWVAKADGAVFPVCPGTAGGQFDKDKYQFVNFSYAEIVKDMREFFSHALLINPKMKFLLTVSPVPLMATATQDQVVVATSYSKSVLRAAAGFLSDRFKKVDYFPSYEIISSHVMRSQFYNPDMRTVAKVGVDHVMKQFFKEHAPPVRKKISSITNESMSHAEDIACDEELLAVFGEA